jgi:hypothetical protein
MQCIIKFIIIIIIITYLLTYLITSCSRILLEKLTGSQLIKKFPAFYGTAFTSVHHLSYPEPARSSLSLLHPTTWRSILILSSYLLIGLPSGLFHSGFRTKTLCTSLLSHIRATCPANNNNNNNNNNNKLWRKLNIVLNDKQNICPVSRFKGSPERYIYFKIIHLAKLRSHFEICLLRHLL